jgi:hypothetical protein
LELENSRIRMKAGILTVVETRAARVTDLVIIAARWIWRLLAAALIGGVS